MRAQQRRSSLSRLLTANVCLSAQEPRSRSTAAFHAQLGSRFLSEIIAFSQLCIESTHTSSYHFWRVN